MIVLLPLLPSTILVVSALILLVMQLVRPNFRYFWLVAVSGSLLGWVSVLFLRFWLPASFDLLLWEPESLFPVSPVFLLDRISWPYALSLSTLALAAILTDISRSTETNRLTWAGSLAFTALGILAAMAGNPLTLMLAWAALDIIELLIMLVRVKPNKQREQVVITFSARVAGILALAAAAGLSREIPLSFTQIAPQSSIFLLLAAGLRLGVFPLHLPFLEQAPLQRGLSTLFTLLPAGTSLMLLTRAATADSSGPLDTPVLLLTGLAVLYASGSWLAAKDELDGRPFWILAFAALAIAAALQGEQLASLAWGITALLSGGLLFLFSARQRNLLFLPILGLIGATMLPLTPSWQAARLYTLPMPVTLTLFFPAHALLLLGYMRHAVRKTEPPNRAERWIWVFYPLGLVLLPITHLLIAWFGNPQSGWETDWPGLLESWPGLVVLALSGGMLVVYRRGLRVPDGAVQLFRRSLSLGWLYRLLWGFYRWLGKFLSLISQILEGEGGLLWALLILTVLLTLLAQQNLGG